jgi:hypothetical protein
MIVLKDYKLQVYSIANYWSYRFGRNDHGLHIKNMIKSFFKIIVKGEHHKNVRDHFLDFDNKNYCSYRLHKLDTIYDKL